MDKKKLEAKMAALKGMSSKLREDTRSPMKDELTKKKMQKVTVIAPDKEGLKKGLSKAEELLRAKYGELGLDEEEMEEESEESSEDSEDGCPICDDSLEDMHEHEETEDEAELE